MTLDPTLFDGMEQAAAHADREEPGWTDRALGFLLVYGDLQAEFISEDVARWAHANGLPDPTDSRAWGAVFNRASRRGLIHKTGGFRAAVTSNGSPKPVWRKA